MSPHCWQYSVSTYQDQVRTCSRAVAAGGPCCSAYGFPAALISSKAYNSHNRLKSGAKQPSVRGHTRLGAAAFARHICCSLLVSSVGIGLTSYVASSSPTVRDVLRQLRSLVQRQSSYSSPTLGATRFRFRCARVGIATNKRSFNDSHM
jgi:hypothetical protein